MAEPVRPGAVQQIWLCMFADEDTKARMCRERECLLNIASMSE